MDIVLQMSIFTLSNAKINILQQKLNIKSYTTIEALLTSKQVELVWNKKFVAAGFNPDDEIFVEHIAYLSNTNFFFS